MILIFLNIALSIEESSKNYLNFFNKHLPRHCANLTREGKAARGCRDGVAAGRSWKTTGGFFGDEHHGKTCSGSTTVSCGLVTDHQSLTRCSSKGGAGIQEDLTARLKAT